jgi:hypothetical protein
MVNYKWSMEVAPVTLSGQRPLANLRTFGAKGRSILRTFLLSPLSVSEHNLSTQPAAVGGHNLQTRRGWSPSLLNPLNFLNPGCGAAPMAPNPFHGCRHIV